MTTLDSEDHYATLINTFTVEPERAEQLLEVLSHATEETMRHLANYAQWKSRADFEAMLKNPLAKGHMTEAAAIATSFTPILYELRHVHAGAP
jgi:quinol monooxygenase YgiN